MKKKIILVLFLIFTATLAFTDSSRFYKQGKVLDTMYVNSPEGLRVRESASLSANKICSLIHRQYVKIVAIGKETTIDGITAPWVEILLPVYEWKDEKAKYGWVFGGYLSEKQPKFTAPKTAAELEQYLSSMRWDEYQNNKENYYIFSFRKDYSFWHGKDGSSIGEGGSWLAISKDTVKFHTSYVMEYEEDNTWELTFTFRDDGAFFCNTGNGEANYYYPAVWDREGAQCYFMGYYGSSIKEVLAENWYSDPVMERNEKHRVIYDMIKCGISAEGTDYEALYHEIWDPIMAEHQRLAN